MAAYTAIDDPEAYFQVALYTGNYSTQTITLPGDTDLQPDMIWIKERTGTSSHALQDSVRGTGKKIMPNASDVESDETVYITAFNSDGFSIGANNGINQDGIANVAWCWKESATSGFDIVTATGTGSAKTIAHSLSAVPHWIISKEKSGSVNDWTIYHHKNTSAPETDSLILNETNATDDQPCWNDTVPTSSVFSVGTTSVTNRTDSTYVYYLFSEKQGFSKFGKYTGNGNADGTFVYTGFRPAFVMIKRTDSTGWWNIIDNKRLGYNALNPRLYPNENGAEDATEAVMDILSNGFKARATSQYINYSGATYVYAAFAEAPFVNSNGVPNNAR